MKIESLFAKLSNSVKLISLLTIVGSLTACGTIARGDSDRFVFRGLDQTYEPINSCKRGFLGCLGLEPVIYPFVIVSYPIDFAVDILLYPIDQMQEILIKQDHARKYPSITIQAYAINLNTRPGSVSYTLSSLFYKPSFYSKGARYSTRYSIDFKENGTLIKHQTERKYNYDDTKVTEVVFPDPTISDEYKFKFNLRWDERYIDATATEKNKKNYTLTYEYATPLPDYDSRSQFVAFVFLPCHQTQLHFFITEDEMRKTINTISDDSKQLSQLEMAENCPPLQDGVKLLRNSRK